MRRLLWIGALSAIASVQTLPARAERLTLVCSFESGAGKVSYERQVNQILIDTELPKIDLRVAQTMGTSNPINYTYENIAGKHDSIKLVSNGPTIAMAAIRYGDAVLINYDRTTGILNWAFADGSSSFRYTCRT